MTFPVKTFRSTDTGAPVLSGTAGALIAVLDACLVNGYNTVALDSLTRSGSTATATKSTGHGFNAGDIVLIAGAGEAEYNGEQQITSVTTTSFTFTVTGTLATPATGTISAKYAPAGWTKAFSGTNKAAYKSADVAASGCYLRVDDTPTQYPLVRGYEAMTDVDTGTGLFPTSAQAASFYWTKSSTANSTARPWVLIAEARLFYLFAQWHASYSTYEGMNFGDALSYKSGDAYPGIINGQPNSPSTTGGLSFYLINSNAGSTFYMARSYTQIGSAVTLTRGSIYLASTASYGSAGAPYPNPADNAFHVRGPIELWEGTAVPGTVLRGQLPGIYNPLHNNPLSQGDLITNITGLPGRKLMLMKTGGGNTQYPCAVDITGPWR